MYCSAKPLQCAYSGIPHDWFAVGQRAGEALHVVVVPGLAQCPCGGGSLSGIPAIQSRRGSPFLQLRIFASFYTLEVVGPTRRAFPGRRGIEGHPPQVLEGHLGPLVRLVRVHGLGGRRLDHGPSGDHTGGQPGKPGQQREGAAEVSAGTFFVFEQEPVDGVWRSGPIFQSVPTGKLILVVVLKVSLYRLCLVVGAGVARRDSVREFLQSARKTLGQLQVCGVRCCSGPVELRLREGGNIG